jgi:predicted nuclease of predicted toxin-antitoxin system
VLRFAADVNFHGDILRGLLRRMPDLDVVRLQDVGLDQATDPAILEWAAREGRIILSHDVSTLTGEAIRRVHAGLPMPGVFIVRKGAKRVQAIEDLLLLAGASEPGEWKGQVRYIPLD